jgi:hypothetical protein
MFKWLAGTGQGNGMALAIFLACVAITLFLTLLILIAVKIFSKCDQKPINYLITAIIFILIFISFLLLDS